MSHFAKVNEIMSEYCDEPYPARAALGVAALPLGALVEADADPDRLSLKHPVVSKPAAAQTAVHER